MTFRLPTTSTLFPYTTLFRSDIEQHLSVSKLGKLVFTQQHHVLVQAADNHLILSKKFLQRQELEAFVGGFFLFTRSEEHTSELQSRGHLVCRLLLEKKKTKKFSDTHT